MIPFKDSPGALIEDPFLPGRSFPLQRILFCQKYLSFTISVSHQFNIVKDSSWLDLQLPVSFSHSSVSQPTLMWKVFFSFLLFMPPELYHSNFIELVLQSPGWYVIRYHGHVSSSSRKRLESLLESKKVSSVNVNTPSYFGNAPSRLELTGLLSFLIFSSRLVTMCSAQSYSFHVAHSRSVSGGWARSGSFLRCFTRSSFEINASASSLLLKFFFSFFFVFSNLGLPSEGKKTSR